MRKFLLTFTFLTLLFIGCAFSFPYSLKIGVITDIHFLSEELTCEGNALASFVNSTGRNVADLHEVLDEVLVDFHREKIDILLITGDITNHGERLSHTGFIKKLEPLVEAGTRIFVIPGNHDINIPDSRAYIGGKTIPAESVTKEEFAELYRELGYGDAVLRDDTSLSYLAQIDEQTWLLAFDTNRYDEHDNGYMTSGRIRPQTMEWALKILQEANSRGIRVLGMMHHGLVEHMIYQSAFFPDYLIEDWQENADVLADTGLTIVFTGHFHSNDITKRTSPAGNTIYDVETASLAQYPFAYRIMKLRDSDLSIDTRFITSVPSNPDLVKEYFAKLGTITRRVAVSRLNSLGIPIPDELINALADVIVRLNLTHVRGDEKPDPEMLAAIHKFASILGNEVNAEDYSLDFPPADNRLIIEFNNPVNK